MSFVQIVSILGMIPLFSMRTFLPAFLVALFLRYPQYFPGMGEIIPPATGAYITKDWILITLGGLSLLEIIGDKSTEIRNFLKNAETYLKPLVFFVINLNLLDEASVEVLGEVEWAAIDPNWILLLFGTIAVYWLAGIRRDFITFLEEIDEDDNFHLSRISSWLEDSLVLFGFLLLIWLGILMVAIYAAAIFTFLLIKKRHERKLEAQKQACQNCGEMNLPVAVKCYHCRAPLSQIHKIGIFGQRKKELASDIKTHQLQLASHRKCPDCGTTLKNIQLFQTCERCGSTLFDTPTPKEYIQYQDRKFYKLTALSFLLGFIPIVGFVISAVLANIYLFTPYRKYIPSGQSFLTKMFIRFLTFLFFIFGIALGFIAAPGYIIMRYLIWKKRFVKRIPT